MRQEVAGSSARRPLLNKDEVDTVIRVLDLATFDRLGARRTVRSTALP